MLQKTILFFLIILHSVLLSAQETTTFKGFILDSEKNIPIENVNISVVNSSIGSISNSDGGFIINSPSNIKSKFLLISHLGYQSKKIELDSLKNNDIILLTRVYFELEEVAINSHKSDLTANQIINKVFENYANNFPNEPFIAKGFLRHTEKNKKEYKWLIEAGITMYDNTKFGKEAKINLNIDAKRNSSDNRSIDSVHLYFLYLISAKKKKYNIYKGKKRRKIRDTVSKNELARAIKHNDYKSNGLTKIFNGHKNRTKYGVKFYNGNQNIIRNYNSKEAIFDKKILKKHKFSLDTILYEGDRQVYKIKITPNQKMINLNKVLKKHYIPIGWFYIYKDNFAIKELDYTLLAGSKDAKLRNSIVYGTPVHYKINLKYIEYNNKMYLNYYSCSVPKSLNMVLDYSNTGGGGEKFYYTKQEILFTEIITKSVESLASGIKWNSDLFSPMKYDEEYWKKNTILLESKEQQKMIKDLEKKVSLKKQFQQN